MGLPVKPPFAPMEALLVHEIPTGGNWQYEPKRWSTKRSMEWQPLAPKLVVEVQFDHFSGGRFRHGTKFLRWRPDKAPAQCKFDQLGTAGRNLWKLLDGSANGRRQKNGALVRRRRAERSHSAAH